MKRTGWIVFISLFLALRHGSAASGTGDHKVVKVGVYQNPPKCFIAVAVEDAGEFVKLSVKDDGEGMSEEVLANCRRPFYSTKGESGTGMGLAMAANVLEAHGGKLEIQSSPGQGTEVSLLLPQAPA